MFQDGCNIFGGGVYRDLPGGLRNFEMAAGGGGGGGGVDIFFSGDEILRC